MKTILTLMLFVVSANAQQFDAISEKTEDEKKEWKKNFIHGNSNIDHDRRERIRLNGLLTKVNNNVLKMLLHNQKIYMENYGFNKGGINYQNWEEEGKFRKAYNGYIQNVRNAAEYFIYKYDAAGVEKIKLFIKENPFNLEEWKERCGPSKNQFECIGMSMAKSYEYEWPGGVKKTVKVIM